ncbi:MAG: alkaline phosphatase family protein [Candidatus Lokiarchaeota archaeon]
MKRNSNKLILIGIDQAIPYLVTKFMDQGILPNIKKLNDNGIFGEAYSCPPCDTPTNWTTIATGTTTAIHGATSFYLHIPGEPFGESLNHRSRTQLSKYCQAEYIWQVADSQGLIPFVANYPSGWPMEFDNGAIAALIWPIPETIPNVVSRPAILTYRTDLNNTFQISPTHKSFDINKNSENLEFSLEFKYGSMKEPPTLSLYIINKNGKEYDTIYLPKDSKNEEQIIGVNEWSQWISLNISTKYGELPCFLKLKPLELNSDGSKLKLQRTSVYNSKGWTKPDNFGEKIIKNVIQHDLNPKDQEVEYMINEEVESYLLQARLDTQTIGQTVCFAKKDLNWDICFFHAHLLDSVNHKELAYLYEKSPLYSENSSKKAWKNVEMGYRIIDEMVGYIMDKCVDKNTIVVFVADHGAIPAWKVANIKEALKRKDLVSYKWKNSQKKFIIDWKKTKAFPYFEPPYIWVNLKGRDPQGIVNSSEYESVRDEIIDCLLDMRDPKNNQRIVKIALRKEEADFLGQNGDRIGDVVYYLNPPYQIFDGNLQELDASEIYPSSINKSLSYPANGCFGAHVYYVPTQKLGKFSVSCPLIISGPGIKKGYQLNQNVNLVDLAPTFSYLLNIPKPKHSVGRVLYEILE